MQREDMPWSESEDDLLRKYWAEGLSASECAKRIGTGRSRNAAIGRVHRLGLAKRVSPGRAVKSVKRTKAAPSEPRTLGGPPRNMHITRIKPIPAPEKKPNTFDDTPASRAAMALLGQSYNAEKRREMFWGSR